MRAFARDIGVASSYVTNLFKHRTCLPEKIAQRIVKKLDLEEDESKEFLDVVKKDNHHLLEQKKREQQDQKNYVELSGPELEVLRDWTHMQIFTLLECDNFKSDVGWIAEKLSLNTKVVEECLNRLEKIGLVKPTANGIEKVHQKVTTTRDIPSDVIRSLLTQQISAALKKIETVDIDMRDFSCSTIPFDVSKIEDAKKMLLAFRREFVKKFGQGVGKKNHVYNLNLQLFPVSN